MANKQFDTYYYPNRNHGIYGGPTRLHLYTKMTDFLKENLKTRARTANDRPNPGVLRVEPVKKSSRN